MKRRTARFGWTKQFQRVEQSIKTATANLNILNPAHADQIRASAELAGNLHHLYKRRVAALRGNA